MLPYFLHFRAWTLSFPFVNVLGSPDSGICWFRFLCVYINININIYIHIYI